MMPRTIYKADRERDLYVVWSSVVDCPIAWGTRAEIVDYLRMTDHPDAWADERFERVDRSGTSAMWPSRDDPEGGWSDIGWVVTEMDELPEHDSDSHYVWLPRQRLAAFLDALSRSESVDDIVEIREME
jgi:hypothetical protein